MNKSIIMKNTDKQNTTSKKTSKQINQREKNKQKQNKTKIKISLNLSYSKSYFYDKRRNMSL